jgi:hypothetical protein
LIASKIPKTGTKGDDECLQYTDCTVEKCLKVFPPLFSDGSAEPAEKKKPDHRR